MGVNSIIFSFLISIVFSFGDCKNLFELKANKTLTNHSIQLSSSSYLGYCDWNSDCLGFNTKCVDNKCRCAPDYKYDYSSESCQYSLCTSDSDCQTYDYNRYCSFRHCYCYSGYYTDYSNGQKCTYSYDYTWVWIFVGIIIPLKIAILIFYIRRRRRRLLTVVRTNPQPVTIITNTGYGSNPYQTSQGVNNYPTNSLMQSVSPPPPPYSSK